VCVLALTMADVQDDVHQERLWTNAPSRQAMRVDVLNGSPLCLDVALSG
jgi:hypothetical protein